MTTNTPTSSISTPEAQAEDYDCSQTNVIPKGSAEAISEATSDTNKIDKDILIKKLKDIPIEKLKEILTNQLDLEIRLKHKELKLTEEEIGKCESQMLILRNFFEVPNDVKFNEEPSDFTVKYYNLLNKSLSANYSNLKNIENSRNQQTPVGSINRAQAESGQEPIHSYRTRSTTSSLRPSSSVVQKQSLGCLYRRTDGIIVKLTCPDCQRSNFSSAQGFLNHSRIAHSKEYTSQDAAALKCGEILPNIEQDEEGLASLNNLKMKHLDPNKNLNVNEIYFKGLSQTLNTVHKNPAASTNSISFIEKSVSPLEKPYTNVNKQPQESVLMKKLIKDGVASNESEYENLITETKKPVANAHLFDDEVEESQIESDDLKDRETELETKNKLKRRKSRGGININISTNNSSRTTPTNVQSNDISPSSTPPLPKIKLKLKSSNDDLKRRKKV